MGHSASERVRRQKAWRRLAAAEVRRARRASDRASKSESHALNNSSATW